MLLSPVVKVVLSELGEKMHRSGTVYKWKESKIVLNKSVGDFDVRGEQGMDFITGGNVLRVCPEVTV